MALESRARRRTTRRADGVTIAPAPGTRKRFVWLVAAAALVLVAVVIWSGPPRTPRPALHAVRAAQPAPAPEHADAPVAAAPSAAPVAADAPPPVPSGIGLFPPRSTDPPKTGIVVPEGFELPEGYVRHYQVTDGGQPLPPILMFHPDYGWVDEQGRHVEVSKDGVVPPELAPAGMPIEMLALPAPAAPHGPTS